MVDEAEVEMQHGAQSRAVIHGVTCTVLSVLIAVLSVCKPLVASFWAFERGGKGAYGPNLWVCSSPAEVGISTSGMLPDP